MYRNSIISYFWKRRKPTEAINFLQTKAAIPVLCVPPDKGAVLNPQPRHVRKSGGGGRLGGAKLSARERTNIWTQVLAAARNHTTLHCCQKTPQAQTVNVNQICIVMCKSSVLLTCPCSLKVAFFFFFFLTWWSSEAMQQRYFLQQWSSWHPRHMHTKWFQENALLFHGFEMEYLGMSQEGWNTKAIYWHELFLLPKDLFEGDDK